MANQTCILNPDYHSGIGLVQIKCALKLISIDTRAGSKEQNVKSLL